VEKPIYQEKPVNSCETGFESMSNSSVAICGIARDCSSQLTRLIPKLEALGGKFQAHKIIVVENDSADDTAEIILAWAARNKNVIPILFSANKEVAAQQNMSTKRARDFNHSRISRIAFARNLYLHELQNHQQTDYVIVVDLDIMDFSMSGIANSFEQGRKWDCATSSGLRYTLRTPFSPTVYWDTYAYEPCAGFPSGVQRLADIRSSQRQLRERLKSKELIPALSAFGGLAIYRYKILAGHQYGVVKNNDPEVPILCEHVDLHRSISKSTGNFRLVINPLQELRYETLGTTLQRSFLRIF
jgi:hypothetical protein